MDDTEREKEPPASGSGDERESARTATTEFRIPAKVDLTRPDIRVRRPATPPEPPEPPAEPEADEAAPEEAPAATEEAEAEPEAAASDGTGPTRVERLPQLASPQPAVRSSGPWTVQW
ncbi:hypothetical protein, partial [Actinomadura sp. GC306]|uniref:hypothetical protein n=1 Tax=Actinomadura sp. GC306 TaxID=2530367 RepID=UPI001AA0000F